MANIINADNGVVSGISGLTTSADNSGVLQFQTSGTNTLTITTAGNVGVGTTSPGFPITVNSSSAQIAIQNSTTGSSSADGSRFQLLGADLAIVNREAASIQLYTSDTERMRIDSSGNVMVGTTSAGGGSRFTSVAAAAQLAAGYFSGAAGQFALALNTTSGNNFYLGTVSNANESLRFLNSGGSELMRITSGGVVALNNPVNITQTLWSGAPAYQAGNSAAFYGDGQAANWVSGHALNAYRSANTWYYSSTGIPSGRVEYGNGATGAASGFAVYGADAGSAGGAITWTQTLNVSTGTTLALQGATSQSGTGITFPATQSASSDANTLDDYEEGTFTPFFAFGGSTSGQTYGAQSGFYLKIGRQVWLWGYIRITGVGSTSGAGALTGLPFAPVNYAEGNLGGDGWVSTGSSMKLIIDPGTVWLAYQTGNAGANSSWANINQTNVTDGGKYFTASYLAAS